MECPICKTKKRIDIVTNSDGFAANLQECGDCGALWTNKERRAILLRGAYLHSACNG